MTRETSTANLSDDKDFHRKPDPQGQAALLLIESVIHSLLDNGALAKHQALDAIEVAMQVKEEIANEADEDMGAAQRSLALLVKMQNSINAYAERDHRDGAAELGRSNGEVGR